MLSRSLLRSSVSRANLFDRPVPHCEPLESRRLLAQTSTFTQTDGDIYTLNLTGPGSYTVTAAPDGNNINLIALSGTTLASTFSLTRTTVGNNTTGDLRLERLTGGTLDVLTLEAATVDVRPVANPVLRGSAGPGIFLTGYARTINIGDLFDAQIRLESTSSQNRSAITVEDLNDIDNSLQSGGAIFSGGVIESLRAETAPRGSITASRIGSIVVDNSVGLQADEVEPLGGINFTDRFDITTTSTTASYGVKTIVFRQTIEEGTWSIAAPVQSIAIDDVANGILSLARGSIDAPGPFVLNVAGRVGSLTATDTLGGTISARSFGSIRANQEIVATITTTGASSNTANSIDSLRAPQLFNSTITVTNGIGLFNVSRVELSDVTAGWVDSFNVIGSPSNTESVANSDIVLNNTARTSVLRSMIVQGSTTGSNFRFLNNIGTVTLDRLGGSSRFFVGLPLSQTSAPANAAAFTTAGTVDRFTLRSPAAGTANNFGDGAILAARRFNALVADILPISPFANGGNQYGLFADQITSFTGTIRLSLAPSVFNGNFYSSANTVLTDGDFRFTIV